MKLTVEQWKYWESLCRQVEGLLAEGVWHPEDIFWEVYFTTDYPYDQVRDAIHYVKCR